MPYPKMIRIKQHFDSIPPISDINYAIKQEFSKTGIVSPIKSGDRIAITAGSRGVANIEVILKAVVNELKAIGAKPFIIPAMGSHGGATASGQEEVLRHYNITQKTTDAPIISSMETVQIGQSRYGFPVYMDKNAYEADRVIVVNRIKHHTDYTGKIESGLLKMMAIGLGKRDGAATYHKATLHYGFENVIRSVADVVMETGKIAFALGIVENPYEETAIIKALAFDQIVKGEEGILKQAKELAARLPFEQLDVLIVDEAGKEISGTGMDTKIIGRMMQSGEKDLDTPRITRIFLRDLTPKSMGNAAGIGFADFTTRRLVEKINYQSTYMNFITSMGPQKVRVPVYLDTDRKVLDAVFETIGMVKPENSKVVRIKNTLKLGEVDISEKLLELAKERDDLEIIGEAKEMEFDSDDNLLP